jgi:sulfatase modifying factor 1
MDTRAVACVLAGLASAGCQLVWGFKDFDRASGAGAEAGAGGTTNGGAGGGSGSSGGAGTTGSGGSAGAATSCEDSNAPPGTVGVRLPSGACVYMDDREVTNARYQEFVDQLSDLAPYTDVPCQDKTSFDPGCATDGAASSADSEDPVTCVDWCDARAYCRFRGERLCGDPQGSDSWWQAACTAGGAQYKYPYGPSYEAQACNGKDNLGHGCNPTCTLAPVATEPQCKTPSGIFDLSGNASEWVDECSGYSNQLETCTIRGGNVSQDASSLTCDSTQTPPRSTRTALIGFRCCWAPP